MSSFQVAKSSTAKRIPVLVAGEGGLDEAVLGTSCGAQG